MSPYESFPELLKSYRTEMALTQKELAKQWGFSKETISTWERGKRFPRRQQIQRLANLLEMDLEELVRSIRTTVEMARRSNDRGLNIDELKHSKSILELPNQKSCESQIIEASLHAQKTKILTIRGEKYFVGSRGLLAGLLSSGQTEEFSIEVLVLSPEAQHITEELAENLGHTSSAEVKEKMRLTLAHLMHLTRRNNNFKVKCYIQKPNFKILLFDNIMFVSAFVGAKNDDNANMFKITEANNPLFIGFERFFDELWQNAADLH